MESKIIYAKSKEDAVEQLLKSTNADKDSIEVTVKENPTKGILGLFSKDGVYEISYKLTEEIKVEKNVESEVIKTEIEKEETKVEEPVSLDIKEDVSEESKIEVLEVSNKSVVTEEDEVKLAKSFVENILEKAEIKADVIVAVQDDLIKVKILGEEASCLIGRRGDTLDAIQFLTGLVLNKVNKESNTRVFVDIENYRSKREESLKRYCYKVAREVARTKKTKKLDYMNPYERRIIHSALQNDRYVITYSEGTDPYRRVVIEYKK